MKPKKRKRILEYVFVASVIAIVLFLYAIVAKEVAPLFQMNWRKEPEKVKEYLQSFGAKGLFLIVLLEMLQMVIVFLSEDFLQACAGLAFPFYIAIPACALGIFLGSTIIFVIVRALHIRLEFLEKKSGKVTNIVKRVNKKTSMTMIMYLLFITPLIPVGAIAYFASSSNISYRRYALVCTTGAIPSILTSYIMGRVALACIGKGAQYTAIAVAVLLVLTAALFVTMIAIIKRKFYVRNVDEPNAVLYHVLYFFLNIYYSIRLKINHQKCEKIDTDKPVLIVGAHTSFMDYFLVAKAVYPRRLTIVVNRYYYNKRWLRPILKSLGAIPKSLFTTDLETVKKMLIAADLGQTIALFPEGRLSSHGAGFPLMGSMEGLVKRLNLDVYEYHTVGGYYALPKWRPNIVKGEVKLYLHKLYSQNELATMTSEEVDRSIKQKFLYDECSTFSSKGEPTRKTDVRGLERILFRCPSCGEEFSLVSKQNTITCSACGKEMIFDGFYYCDDMSISEMYRHMKEYYAHHSDFVMQDACKVYRQDKETGKMVYYAKGTCTMSEEDGIRFVGQNAGEEVVLHHTPATLPALAFSCDEEFEFYHNFELYYIYPEHKEAIAKWSMLWDILRERYLENKAKEEA